MHSTRFAARFAARFVGLGLATLAAALLPGQARAQVGVNIMPTITPAGGGLTSYAYTLQDTGTSALGKFDLSVPASGSLTNVTAPTGWLALYTPGDFYIEWDATTALPKPDIAPGNSLSGFGFQAPFAAGPEVYQVMSFDDGSTAGGTTQGPVAPVPEASTTVSLGLLLCLGLSGLLLARKKAKA